MRLHWGGHWYQNVGLGSGQGPIWQKKIFIRNKSKMSKYTMKTGKEPVEQIYSSWKIGIIECTQITVY